MVLTARSAYRLAGHQFSDTDFDKNANIENAKLGTRTLTRTYPATAMHLNGASVAKTFVGVFGGVTLPDANIGNLYPTLPIPAEYDSGNVIVRVLWNTAATSGDAKLAINSKPVIEGSTTAQNATDSTTDTAKGTTLLLNELSITIAEADFRVIGNEQMIGFELTRNPGDGGDTLSADMIIFAISLEFTGRG